MHEELEAIDWILVVCAVTCVRYISLCYSQLRRHPRDKQEDSHAAASAVLNASRAGAASRRRIGRNGSVRA